VVEDERANGSENATVRYWPILRERQESVAFGIGAIDEFHGRFVDVDLIEVDWGRVSASRAMKPAISCSVIIPFSVRVTASGTRSRDESSVA
jgi:hypothetical protein